MKLPFQILLACLLATTAFAAEKLPAPSISERGALLLSEEFSKPIATIVAGNNYKTKDGWCVFSGGWEFTNGALKGFQMKTDGRSAFVVRYLPFKEAAIQFDVRLDGCRQVIFRIQDAKPEHICSVRINHDGFTAQKDDHDHGGPDQAVPFGKVALSIKSGEWKTVLVEIKGEQMVTTMDGHRIAGAHPLLAAEKATFEFVVTGDAASFRNVRVWGVADAPPRSRKL